MYCRILEFDKETETWSEVGNMIRAEAKHAQGAAERLNKRGESVPRVLMSFAVKAKVGRTQNI